jgi:hypothetical protein
MRVHVSDPRAVPDLLASLLRGACVATRIDRNICEVVHLHATDESEAKIELHFFLRAWQCRYYGVEAVLID